MLRSAFRATDAAGVEAMALLYGAREGGKVAFTMSDILVVEHVSATFSCEPTPAGLQQWLAFQEQHPHLSCLGWAHSHHQVALVEQGRTPSAADINTQWQLQRTYAGTANLMLILNENGWTPWTLPHSVITLMASHGGSCSTSTFPHEPLELPQQVSFLSFVRESSAEVRLHQLGAPVASASRSPSELQPTVRTSSSRPRRSSRIPSSIIPGANPIAFHNVVHD